MALETKKNDTKAPQTSSPKAPAQAAMDPKEREAMFGAATPDGWAETGTQYLYRAEDFVVDKAGGIERCYRTVEGKQVFASPLVQGYPFAVVERDSKSYGPYEQVAIQLTRPTIVMVGEEGARQEQVVPVGATVLITLTKGIERLGQIAEMTDASIEVMVRPTQKEPIGDGKTMWRWNIRENPVRMQRVRLEAPKDAGSLSS